MSIQAMYASAVRITSLSTVLKPKSSQKSFNATLTILKTLAHPPFLRYSSSKSSMIVIMRDRSKNRKPLQRGRISTEAIQAVQALKRAKNDGDLLESVMESKVRRLVKQDIIAVLRDLQRQNEALLALKVFEDIRKEYWYKPQVLVYAGMIKVLANNGLFEMVERVFLYMKMESNLEADLEAFNALLQTFMDFSIVELVMECFHLMKVVECEPDKSTFKILINGLESKGETGLSTIVRQEAKKYYGGSLEFLQEKEDTSLICN